MNNSTVVMDTSYGIIDTCFIVCLGILLSVFLFTLSWAAVLKLVERIRTGE